MGLREVTAVGLTCILGMQCALDPLFHFCGQNFEEFHQYSAKINVRRFKMLKACGFEHLKVKNLRHKYW